MRLNPDVMSLDDGSINSLSALDIILGIKAAETVTPTVPTTDQSDAKLTQQAASVPQAAVPAVAQGTVNTSTIAGINAASNTNTTATTKKTDGGILLDNYNPLTGVMTASPVVDPKVTAYTDLTPAQRAAMSQQEKVDYLKAARDAGDAAEATARAATNPMYNFKVRPEAPVKAGMIQYYSWQGDTTSGSWKLYAAPDTPENQAKYGARSTGGATQATPDSPTGANSLVAPPVWDPVSSTWKPAGFVPATTKSTVTNVSSNIDYSSVNGVLNFKGSPFTGVYSGYNYVNGVKQGGNTSSTTLTTNPISGSNYGGSGSTTDPFTVDSKPYTGTMFGSTYNNGVLVDTAAKTADDIAKQGRLDARTEFSNTLKALGLPQNLVDELDNMIKQDYTKSQMYLELQKTPAWKERFPGMEALAAAGKAIDAGTYISQEKSMLQTLDYYGIDKKIFGTTAELGKQIGNLVSPKRFETVVALAAQDVEQNPDVLAELNMYYGVDKSAAISYLLNPTIGLDIIQRQARAAEIGAKAGKSKFDFGMAKEGAGVAESFINAAGTMDLQALDVAFQQARGLSDIQTSIAATEGASYNDLQAVSAILGKDQAAILDSQRRAARSVAKFSGGSGLGSGSLKRETTI
jgi:hypothetical protein